MKKVFLDTSYLIALESLDDQNHQSALEHWEIFRRTLPQLVTTSFVFNEVVTFFNSRHRHDKALEIGGILLGSPSIELVQINERLFHEAWRYFRRHADKTYSFTDCASFLVMRRHRIRVALTFDQHFVQAGFQRIP